MTDPNALRIMILGGTGFIGPHFVKAAAGRGHRVTVFNRGKAEAALPAGVEQCIGDRGAGDLDAIKGRDWDAVVDLAAYEPSWVRSAGEVLATRTKHYTFISTLAVFGLPSLGFETTEASATLEAAWDPKAISDPSMRYGSLKVGCEQESARQFPGRALILRPGYIVGPGDPQGYLAYWLARFTKGGTVLAAGSVNMPVQFIDVGDLARWTIALIEQGVTGTFNAVGPDVPLTMADLLSCARQSVSAQAEVAWVDPDWLASNNSNGIWGMPLFWSLNGWGRSMQINNAAALASGLALRPLSATLADILAWQADMPVADEVQLGWRKNPVTGAAEQATMPWPRYIAEERKLLRDFAGTGQQADASGSRLTVESD